MSSLSKLALRSVRRTACRTAAVCFVALVAGRAGVSLAADAAPAAGAGGASAGGAAAGDAGSWAFEHPQDTFKPGALLDLRPLNEKEAGQSGFVRLGPDGNGFASGDGKPAAFLGGGE